MPRQLSSEAAYAAGSGRVWLRKAKEVVCLPVGFSGAVCFVVALMIMFLLSPKDYARDR